jgi:CDP-diacylglycerol--serine O-phosphatidyltransferase
VDRIIKNIPNFFTLLNLLLGCLAIVFLFYDHIYIVDQGTSGIIVDMAHISTACLILYFAAGLDLMDGFLARLLKAQSPIGKQLDSLADLVTFGLVPGLILYQLMARAFYLSRDAFDMPIIWFSLGFLYTLFAAWRLARFNSDDETDGGFTGLPTPAAALLVASLPMIVLSDKTGLSYFLNDKWVILGIILVIGMMMVSSIPMLSLKVKSFRFQDHPWEIGGFFSGWALFFLCIFALKLQWLTIPLCFVWYLLLSTGQRILAKES